MRISCIIISFFIIFKVGGQVPESSSLYFAKEYSKEIALYKAKDFVMHEVIGCENEPIKFKIDPLAAAVSGELTSLVYTCEQKQMSGLVLGFYGTRWNAAGVIYQAYAFKHLPEKEALELLAKIDNIKDQYNDYLRSDLDNNNVFFEFDDMTFLIFIDYSGLTIRVFWNEFDAEWESLAFDRTKKRFERLVNK